MTKKTNTTHLIEKQFKFPDDNYENKTSWQELAEKMLKIVPLSAEEILIKANQDQRYILSKEIKKD